MSIFDDVVGLTKEVSTSLKREAKSFSRALDHELSGEAWYKDAKSKGESFYDSAIKATHTAKNIADEAFVEISKTESGKVVGRSVEMSLAKLARMPIITMATDILRISHGLSDLSSQVKDDPENAEKRIWLAEAFVKYNKDRDTYIKIRSVLHPGTLLISEAGKAAVKLNNENRESEPDSESDKLLKIAFMHAAKKLRTRESIEKSLHVLSRVYLLKEQSIESMRFSKLAIVSNPQEGMYYTTLARGYRQLHQNANAAKAAVRAINLGSTVGNEILADILEASRRGKIGDGKIASKRSAITEEDRIKYWGTAKSGADIATAVGEEQWKKASALLGL